MAREEIDGIDVDLTLLGWSARVVPILLVGLLLGHRDQAVTDHLGVPGLAERVGVHTEEDADQLRELGATADPDELITVLRVAAADAIRHVEDAGSLAALALAGEQS